MAKELKVRFVFERSTKGAHRYQEVDAKGAPVEGMDGAAIGTLYLRKSAIGDEPAKNLEVTIIGK